MPIAGSWKSTRTIEGRRRGSCDNLSREPCDVTLDLGNWEREQLVDLFGDRQYEPLSAKKATMRMEGYGYRWLRAGNLR